MSRSVRVSDLELAQALAVNPNREEVARQLGLSVRSVFRRLADPEFDVLYQQVRVERLSRIAAAWNNLDALATDKLKGLMESDDARVRLKAVELWAKVSLRLTDQEFLGRSITEIHKRQVKGVKRGDDRRNASRGRKTEGDNQPANGDGHEAGNHPSGPNGVAPERGDYAGFLATEDREIDGG